MTADDSIQFFWNNYADVHLRLPYDDNLEKYYRDVCIIVTQRFCIVHSRMIFFLKMLRNCSKSLLLSCESEKVHEDIMLCLELLLQ